MKRSSELLAAALLLFFLTASASADDSIKNPYYKTPEWKLWARDPTPVSNPLLIAPGQIGQCTPSPESARLYPDDADPKLAPAHVIAFRKTDWPDRKYAGFWDDVYLSLDNNGTNPPTPHSWMPSLTAYNNFGHDVPDLKGKFLAIYCPMLSGRAIKSFGVNFTSQSTTGVGNDIANNAFAVAQIEREFYFADCLRAGPAAVGAYAEQDFYHVEDKYEALVPSYYNSCGMSNSETHALVKMLLAGAYLPKELKPELKRNGLYIATLLYIWKAALPFDVPYDSELRHRVAYCSSGTELNTGYFPVNREFHLYDENAHLANMIALAKSLKVAPPIALLKKVDLAGGKEIYFLKTAALIHQKTGETIKLRVSTADCYDLAGKPFTLRWKVLYGQMKTTIEREGNSDTWLITVPPDDKLPAGRTSILLIANNGVFDSNPACINIFRPDGKPNLRPTLEIPAGFTILPGEKVSFDVKCQDPEGFPTVLYRRTGEVGTLAKNTFTWECPANQPDGVYPVTILASDTTTGTNSGQVPITVTSTKAVITADKSSGPAPLAIKFSAAKSSDRQKNPLTCQWDFGDGQTSTDPQPSHTFSTPGFYRVTLTAKGPLGSHTDQLIVTAVHAWPLQLNNGWSKTGLDPALWNTKNLALTFATLKGDNLQLSRPKDNKDILETAQPSQPPFYLEIQFTQFWANKDDHFDFLGVQLGWANGSTSFQIRNAAGDKKQDIGLYLSDGTAEKATLRLYIIPDPAHPGKTRYTGYFDTLTGSHFFSFDDQSTTPAPLQTICAFSRMEISRFQIWSPPSDPKP